MTTVVFTARPCGSGSQLEMLRQDNKKVSATDPWSSESRWIRIAGSGLAYASFIAEREHNVPLTAGALITRPALSHVAETRTVLQDPEKTMADNRMTAYLTGGASGIGKAVATMLASRSIGIIIADRNVEGARQVCEELSAKYRVRSLALEVDVSSWDSQLSAFETAARGNDIRFVLPIAGIGETVFIRNRRDTMPNSYEKPDLTALDVNLKGALYTAALGIQHFRRHEPDENGIRGKIIVTASMCSFYAVPTMPIYTAAKHGVLGFVRSYGAHLPAEGILLNAVAPHIVQTSISTPDFYATAARLGLVTPGAGVVHAFEQFLQDHQRSGECIEVSPTGSRKVAAIEYMDDCAQDCCKLLLERCQGFHEPVG